LFGYSIECLKKGQNQQNSKSNTFDYDDHAAEAAKKAKKAKAAAGEASASAVVPAAAGQGGYSRKRRLHTNRPRKTMKKYARRVTRRRGRGRRSQRR
jgi:hypothetical protein